MKQIQNVGVIGLGNMGGRIARRIKVEGWPVVGFDVDPQVRESAGIPTVASIAELAAGADAILLSLPNSAVVESVVLGEDGLREHVAVGQVVVDLSTADPNSTRRLHAELLDVGVELVDAGVSGGASAAERGTLTIMAGGEAEVVAALDDVLSSFCERVFHMGDAGAGHVAKVLNNFLNGVSLAATAEVMVAAKKAGLDLGQFLEVVNTSSGVNFATLNRFPRIVEGDYLEGGLTSNLMAKDIRLYLELMRTLQATSLAGAACLGAFDLANALGYGDQISNRVVDALGDLSGGVRLHDVAQVSS